MHFTIDNNNFHKIKNKWENIQNAGPIIVITEYCENKKYAEIVRTVPQQVSHCRVSSLADITVYVLHRGCWLKTGRN